MVEDVARGSQSCVVPTASMVWALVLAKRPRRSWPPLASGHPEPFGGLSSWATPTFEVTSGVPIEMRPDR